jgi:hypothetical protein
MNAMARALPLIALAVGAFAAACGGTTTSNDKGPGSGGAAAGAGASAAGGPAAGGSTGAGGTPKGSGGTTGNGGTTGSGGKSAAGGKSTSGGASSSGGASQGAGGAPSAGGKASSGGSLGAGGAPSDGGTAPIAGCEDAVVSTVSWGSNGGLVRYQDTSKLDPPRAYTHMRDNLGNAAPITCHTELAGCPSLAIAEINRALVNPTVRGALAMHTVYGVDSRPVDGTVFRIQLGADYLDVGTPCGMPPSGCTQIPAVVQGLVDGLTAVDGTELAKTACKSVFP